MAAPTTKESSIDFLHDIFETLVKNMSTTDKMRFQTNALRTANLGRLSTPANLRDLPEKLYKNCEALTFFKILESRDLVDDTSVGFVTENLRINNPELSELTSLHINKKVDVDPVSDFLEKTRQPQHWPSSKRRSSRLDNKRRSSCFGDEQAEHPSKCARTEHHSHTDTIEDKHNSHPIRHTCDVRLCVKADFVNHLEFLAANVHSNKPQLMAQQLDRFNQASTILKARDLGAVVCDIKFSEITSLDAFWRDYVNGSLVKALKGMFFSETISQIDGEERLNILVRVEEEDYRNGRHKLLQNLKP